MIKIADKGNTVIEIARGSQENYEQWSVYPHKVDDPTFQKLTNEQQNLAKELSITGIRNREDLFSHLMNQDIAEAIARLNDNLSSPRFKGLGLVANKIGIEPTGEIAQILEQKYGIKSVEGDTPAETKG
ncbi:MAG: hypothetical protein ABSE04_01780 [Candidatus Microgenomates bacterium]|jgi:hypothetical protein